MIEGGLMSMPSCEESILNCSLGTPRECCRNSRLILTKNGPCYRLKWSGPDKREDRSIDNSLGFYVKQARHDLNLSITLSGTSSSRVGYPIMNAKYFGKGYLCPENWGDTEAGVMCRSLGFSGGERFFMDGAPTFGPSNIFGLRIQCKGHEESLLECESDYRDLSGNTLSQCEIQTPVAIICDQGAIELEANRNIRTRGLAFIKAKPNRSADPEESYFCADSFSNKEALVFCKMLSWEFGKAISLPYSNLTTYSYLHGISCGSKSEEPHILGCSKYGNGSTPCTKGPAAVECSPGYPFTLRLLTGPMGRNMPPEAELAVGYPVIDTPSSPGFICDRHLNDEVVGMICKALGFKFGRKLPSGLYGHPQVGKDLLFVLEKLACSGNERSIFECQIGPWGAHKCDEAEILSLACANDKSKFDFEPVIVNQDSLEALGSNQNGFVGIQTSLGIIPGCQGTQTNGARLWGDREANALCLEKEFECGMLNRTTDRLERVLGHDGFLQDVFARFNCSGKHEELTSLMSCQPRLSSTCPSRETGSTICLYRSHPDFELCKLLQTEFQGRDMTSSSYLLQRDRTLHLEIAFQNETKTGTEIQGSCKNSTISSSPIKVFVGDLGEAGKGNMVALERRSRTDIQVSAKLIDTTEQVMREWTWESDRWCRNGDLNYSRKDCSLQCQASLAMAVCDCLPWSLSRTPLPENGLSTICTGASILCLRKIETTLEVAARNITLAERILRGQELNINGLGNVRDRCRCPPPCQGVVQYHVESTTFRGSQGTCGNEGENGNAWFHLYLDRTASISYLRRTKLPWELLLALVGGVMTLFCGFSLISILEWVYFHTIRWWHNAHDPMVSDGNYKPLEDGLEGQDPIRRSYSDPELGPKVHFKDEPITNGASRQSTGLRRRNQSRTTTAISRKSVPPPSRNLSLTSVKNSKSRVSTAANTSARSKPLRTRSVKSTTSRRTIDHNGMPPLDGM
ncbi:uncharacterized protein LOC131893304 [Tigriopus californicus]|uniref:uncharacterized protein LOC131893304 n=1 Tax=Tigriopus californicus TaxID=6832 RepID=UPI0027DA6B22|nr:uncharacterized protein LOC131893304 [Tigriopus californicus]